MTEMIGGGAEMMKDGAGMMQESVRLKLTVFGSAESTKAMLSEVFNLVQRVLNK